MTVKHLAMQVAVAVLVVDDEDGVQWRQWGRVQWWRQCLMEATQQLAGAQREDERAAQ